MTFPVPAFIRRFRNLFVRIVLLEASKQIASRRLLSSSELVFELRADMNNHSPSLQLAALGMAVLSMFVAATERDPEWFGLCFAMSTTFALYAFVAHRRNLEAETQIWVLAKNE